MDKHLESLWEAIWDSKIKANITGRFFGMMNCFTAVRLSLEASGIWRPYTWDLDCPKDILKTGRRIFYNDLSELRPNDIVLWWWLPFHEKLRYTHTELYMGDGICYHFSRSFTSRKSEISEYNNDILTETEGTEDKVGYIIIRPYRVED